MTGEDGMNGEMDGRSGPAVLNQRAWAAVTDWATKFIFDLEHDLSSPFGLFKV